MVGNRTTRTAVLVAVGVVAAATVATVLLLGGAEQVQEPSVGGAEQVQEPSVGGAEQVQEPEPEPPEESAQKAAAASQAEDASATPAMSTANDVAPLAESSVTAATDSAARVDGQVAGGSNESSGPASAVMSTDEPAPDVEFALEIVEATDSDFGAAAGGAHQETPVEQAGSDGSDTGSGDLVSAQGEVYTWHDGDRTLRARLQLDLVLMGDGSITSKDDVVADTGHGQIVRAPGGNGQPTDVEGESDTADLRHIETDADETMEANWTVEFGVTSGSLEYTVGGLDGEGATEQDGLGVLVITHSSRVFDHLRPDAVHVFAAGRIQESGGPELADELEAEGYERWTAAVGVPEPAVTPFTDPFGDPFADLLA